MKTATFLRIASVVTLIFATLHTIGGVFGKPLPGVAEQTVAVMKANQFQLFGHPRTYWDFYMGLGLSVTISLTAEATLLWLLASLAPLLGTRVRPILIVFAIENAIVAVNANRYFFVGPVIASSVLVCLFVAASIAARAAEPSPASVAGVSASTR
jgi:hypothetical protein